MVKRKVERKEERKKRKERKRLVRICDGKADS